MTTQALWRKDGFRQQISLIINNGNDNHFLINPSLWYDWCVVAHTNKGATNIMWTCQGFFFLPLLIQLLFVLILSSFPRSPPSLCEYIIVILQYPLSEAICMTSSLMRRDVSFLLYFEDRIIKYYSLNDQILHWFLSSRHLDPSLFCFISHFDSSQKLDEKTSDSLHRLPVEELQKVSLWHDMKSVTLMPFLIV